MARLLLRELPHSEQPVERVINQGAGALSDAELVEVVLGTPEALGREVLAKFGGLRGLSRTDLIELRNFNGIGRVMAARLLSAIELGIRVSKTTEQDYAVVKSPQDAALYVMSDMERLDHEELWVLVLDTRNHVVAVDKLYRGNVNTSIIRMGELFRTAVKYNASAVVVVHNHPSGDPSPSPEDVETTVAMVKAGDFLDIIVLDHLVIGAGRYISMKERGLGFPY